MSISHWGMFEVEPKILVWPKGVKISQPLEEFRLAARAAGFDRVIVDMSDLVP